MLVVGSSMREIEELLSLPYEADFIFRQIAASLKIFVGTISKYTEAAELTGSS